MLQETKAQGSKDTGGIILLFLVALIALGATFADLEGLLIFRGPPIWFVKGFGILLATSALIFAVKLFHKK